MGQMRFHAPKPDTLAPGAIEQAYLAGIEGVPWYGHNKWSDGQLVIERATDESGILYIPWEVHGQGNRVLSTCNLMERKEPYCLATELARGTIHRARSLATDLESSDIALPPEAEAVLEQGLQEFFRAIMSTACSLEPAETAIQCASSAIEQLCQHYAREALAERQRGAGALASLLGARLDSTVPVKEARFLEAFNAAVVPFRWRDLQPTDDQLCWQPIETQVAWCHQHSLRVLAGPLIQLDRLSLPDWTYLWEDNYDAFESFAIRYIDQVVRHFENDVDIWYCAGRLNLGGDMAFSEEEKLRLAVATIETVRRASPRTPVIVGFDQPWAEYLAHDQFDLSPLHFADALVRADLGVAGIGIEINLGYWPHGSLPRDPLEIIRHIDRWSLLGLPLIVFLTSASGVAPDPNAASRSQPVPRDRNSPNAPAMNQVSMADLVPLLFTRTGLHAIFWNHWNDARSHEFPHSGLIDANGDPKPLVERLIAFRQQHLA